MKHYEQGTDDIKRFSLGDKLLPGEVIMNTNQIEAVLNDIEERLSSLEDGHHGGTEALCPLCKKEHLTDMPSTKKKICSCGYELDLKGM